MSKRNKLAIIGAVGLISVSIPALARELPPTKNMLRKAVAIENTGSTNTAGYKVYVWSSGTVLFTEGKDVSASVPYDVTSLSKAETHTLFHDIAVAMPISSLPVRRGMRSASFGTQTFITYKGQKSPDLTFGGDAKTAALKADVDAITQTLHIRNTPRRPVMPLPQNTTH